MMLIDPTEAGAAGVDPTITYIGSGERNTSSVTHDFTINVGDNTTRNLIVTSAAGHVSSFPGFSAITCLDGGTDTLDLQVSRSSFGCAIAHITGAPTDGSNNYRIRVTMGAALVRCAISLYYYTAGSLSPINTYSNSNSTGTTNTSSISVSSPCFVVGTGESNLTSSSPQYYWSGIEAEVVDISDAFNSSTAYTSGHVTISNNQTANIGQTQSVSGSWCICGAIFA